MTTLESSIHVFPICIYLVIVFTAVINGLTSTLIYFVLLSHILIIHCIFVFYTFFIMCMGK